MERCWRALSADERRRLLGSAAAALSPRWAQRLVGGAGEAHRTGESSTDPLAVDDQNLGGAVAGETAAAGDNPLEAALDDAQVLDRYERLLAQEYPSLVDPLIRERDIFLSLTLKSSMAVSGTRRVLGVVGKGHQAGVTRALSESHPGAFKALTWTPRRAAAKQKVLGIPKPLAQRLALDAGLGGAAIAWWAWGGGGAPPV